VTRPVPDWAAYDTCPTCHTGPGDACTVTAGGAMPLTQPHPARARTGEPPLFEITQETR
jgi:hypothetical protein